MEEELFRDEKELEEEEKEVKIEDSEEEKSSESEGGAKEVVENLQIEEGENGEDLVNIMEKEKHDGENTPKKEVKNPKIVDLSEKKLPKDIDLCRFSNDFLCEFSKREIDKIWFNRW